jgi:hypothetical protein
MATKVGASHDLGSEKTENLESFVQFINLSECSPTACKKALILVVYDAR